MRLAFLGTPDAAVPSLRALVEAGHDVAVVVTRPDRRRARGPELSASPVKVVAQELGLTVVHRLSDLDPTSVERAVVVAYGVIIPPALLDRLPMLNVHFSLLPRWRGAAPVERAILAGDTVSGVSVMSLDEHLDTGPVHLERTTTIDSKSAPELMSELAELGARALIEVLASRELLEHPRPQRGEATYAEKISAEILRLRSTMTCVEALRTIQVGRAFCILEGRRLRIDAAHAAPRDDVQSGAVGWTDTQVLLGCADGAIALDSVQPEGGRPMSAAAWWAGARLDALYARWS